MAKGIGIEMSFQEIIERHPRAAGGGLLRHLSLYVIDKGAMVSRTVFVSNHHARAAPEEAAPLPGEQKDEQAAEALWQVLAEKRTILIEHRTGESPDAGLPSVTLIPLLVKEKVIGVLEVISGSGFEDSDLHFLEQVADQLAVGLENARLYNEVWQHKQEWEITFSAVTDLLLFINRDCRIQRVNQAVIDFLPCPGGDPGAEIPSFYGRESKCNPCLMEQVVRTQKTAYLQSRTRFNRVLDIFAYPAYTEKNSLTASPTLRM